MYAVPLRLYSVPTCRPIMESSAKMYTLVMRSAGVIAATVGRGASLIGNEPADGTEAGTEAGTTLCPAQARRVAKMPPSASAAAGRADVMRLSESECVNV
jgi:hypothetical protein